MKPTIILAVLLSCMSTGCVLAPLLCFLSFSDYTGTYNYNFSKKELKDKIIEAYTYDESLLKQNLGKTLIESDDINKAYRTSVDAYLDKRNWDHFKSGIRQSMPDTLHLLIGKLQSSKQIKLQVIVQGDDSKSSLTINGFTYRRRRVCDKDKDYYKLILTKRIEEKFINRLK